MTKRRCGERDRAIGARIRLARLDRRLSQLKLAEYLGVSCQQLQKYENGRNRVAASMIEDLAAILEKPLVYFLTTDAAELVSAACLALPDRDRRTARQSATAIQTLLNGGAADAAVVSCKPEQVAA